MEVVLDLFNFDCKEADESKYVLTSPRSLEACSRLKIKPVELLRKSPSEFSQEHAGKSIELIQACFCFENNVSLCSLKLYLNFKIRQWLFCRRRQFTLRDYFAMSCL